VVHHWPTPHTDLLTQYIDWRVRPELAHLVAAGGYLTRGPVDQDAV
jgi:hypothetical protein